MEQIISDRITQPTQEEWKKKWEEFYSLWQIPSCIGAIDGTHTVRYKHRITVVPFSLTTIDIFLVLLALVYANYKFTKIDLGGYGKSSDGGLFTR